MTVSSVNVTAFPIGQLANFTTEDTATLPIVAITEVPALTTPRPTSILELIDLANLKAAILQSHESRNTTFHYMSFIGNLKYNKLFNI